MTYDIKYPQCPECGSDNISTRLNQQLHYVALCGDCGYSGDGRRHEGDSFRAFMRVE